MPDASATQPPPDEPQPGHKKIEAFDDRDALRVRFALRPLVESLTRMTAEIRRVADARQPVELAPAEHVGEARQCVCQTWAGLTTNHKNGCPCANGECATCHGMLAGWCRDCGRRVPDGADSEGLHCVCGDPVQWMEADDEPGWIHSPGSETRCLNARPRCPRCQLPHVLVPGWFLLCASVRAAPAPAAAEPAAKPTLAYGGMGRVFCIVCPRPEAEDVPYAADHVDPQELCAGCGRPVIDVAEQAANRTAEQP